MRAAIYVRVSTSGQEQDGTSLVTQEQYCRAWVTERGGIVPDEQVYVEVHSGAYLWERPQLTRLRAAMRAGAFDVLVVYAIDRLSREQDHLGLIVSEAQHYGCRLAAVTEDWDSSPLGKFLRSATAFAGELERAKILERTSRGKRARVVGGKPLPGKRALYGYTWNAEHTACIINELEAQIVRRIFVEIAAGETLHGMAAKLTREGVPIPWPTARNRCGWSHGTIRHICQTPAYWGQPSAYRWQTRTHQERDPRTGAMRTRKSSVERAKDQQVPLSTAVIPPLVDPGLAQEVANRPAHNRRYVRRPRCITTRSCRVATGFVASAAAR